MFTATICGVTLTKEQLEEGLKQIKKQEETWMPMPGQFFRAIYNGGSVDTVALCIHRNYTIHRSARVTGVGRSGMLRAYHEESTKFVPAKPWTE